MVMTDAELDKWVAHFPNIKKSSQALWKAIYHEFQVQQPPMTVRQMFYRMSAQNMVDKSENGYGQVQYALTSMRQAGAIPYSWLADNTRWVRKPRTYSGLSDALRQMQQYYRRELWANQPIHLEIWLEKDALAGVLFDVTAEYDIPLYVTRGYPSLSYLHNAAEALNGIYKPIYIYHFGDYDASGQDAARSIRDGLIRFGATFEFIQYAVTKEQIDSFSLQTRPSKKSDPRAARHGELSVELDAISPADLRGMVRTVIDDHIDPDALRAAQLLEAHEKGVIGDLIGDFRTRSKISKN